MAKIMFVLNPGGIVVAVDEAEGEALISGPYGRDAHGTKRPFLKVGTGDSPKDVSKFADDAGKPNEDVRKALASVRPDLAPNDADEAPTPRAGAAKKGR